MRAANLWAGVGVLVLLTAPAAIGQPATPQRLDPYKNFRFRVEFDGGTRAGFSEITGLDSETNVIEYRNGSEGVHQRKLSGLRKYSTVTLKRGFTSDTSFWTWIRQSRAEPMAQRRDLQIRVLGGAGAPVRSYSLHRCWPVKYVGPAFAGKSNEAAIESLEIRCEGLEIR